MRRLLIICLLLLFTVAVINAESNQEDIPAKVQKKVTSTINIRQETQKREDAWAGQKAELIARYRSLQAELEYLKKVKVKTEQMLHAQEVQIAEIEHMIKESAKIKKELQSYLELVIEQLEEQIKKDIPYLSKERADRITSIKETLILPDKPLAEKYRRVMEALEIEVEYGRSVEVYQETVDLGGEPLLVDVLRVGRLSLFCRTPDGKLIGTFDQRDQKWVVLPSKYRREINKAIEIANRQRPIELVRLPIGRIAVP
ncbi:MAG: DUF3450 domain-containing protein [Deltaproteobacteria bacterium]|nr:DUF3450 domain-containing protein [Deltaproteobacteria bacterium]